MTLDMVMPRMPGIKVIRELRKQKKWAKLPIIIITAHARDDMGTDQIKEFMALTANVRPKFILDKPISTTNLIKTTCKILEVEWDGLGGYLFFVDLYLIKPIKRFSPLSH